MKPNSIYCHNFSLTLILNGFQILFGHFKWTSFNQISRTNNDAEGWHNRVNSRSRQTELNFYELVSRLFDEAKTIPLQVKLMCQDIIMQYVRMETNELHFKLFNIWDSYIAKEFRTDVLLEKCFKLYTSHNLYVTDDDVDGEKEEELSDAESHV